MYKKIRMDFIEEDIERSLLFEEEYKEIKQRYIDAKTDEDWEKAINDHEKLNEEEAERLFEWAAALKKMSFKKVN